MRNLFALLTGNRERGQLQSYPENFGASISPNRILPLAGLKFGTIKHGTRIDCIQSREAARNFDYFIRNPKLLSERNFNYAHVWTKDGDYLGAIRSIRRLPGNIFMMETSYLRIDGATCYYAGLNENELSSTVYVRYFH